MADDLRSTRGEECAAAVEHLDVLIVGAGISGIGAAYYLRRDHPEKSFAILEARAATGGTWDLFRYPGVRSDSDLFTFGYEFQPWRSDKSIATADSILTYLRETASEHGIEEKIRLRHKVIGASWSSAEARWLVDVERGQSGDRAQIACRWIFCASGYYRYDEGHAPSFPGIERYQGRVVHPQHWPEDFDYAGERVLIIGSGATAVTLLPAMADEAAHVTMLQRTPSYILPLPSEDRIGRLLRKLLPARWAHALIRKKNIALQVAFWRFCRRFPRAARRLIRSANVRQLPAGYPVDEHFRPPYAPWDQRLCVVPDGDFFAAIREGRASVLTDTIETFTEGGVRLSSGQDVEADLVVTATGLRLLAIGGMELCVDGEPVHLADRIAFRGMMFSGVPNFVQAFGYVNASWTLKIGLLCEHLGRLLSYMDAEGYETCVPQPQDPDMPTRPLIDFGANYVQRSVHELPRQGERPPWRTPSDYGEDLRLLRDGPVSDPELRFA